MAGVFGCSVGTYPFTYLGLPMGTTKPRVEHFAPLVCRIERRITTTASWLTMAGRATLVDMAISPIPIYTMCSIKMHAMNLRSVDRINKNGLWRGSDVAGKGKPLVGWENVTTPKDKGGLGLKNMSIMNDALLTKYLHKLYNKEDTLWVQLVWNTHYANGKSPHETRGKGSFWLKHLMKLSSIYRGIASATIGPGNSVLLWEDVWNGHCLINELPRLFSFARNKRVPIANYLANPEVQQNFYTPLSQQALEELNQLEQMMDQAQQSQLDNDVWGYIWGNNQYSSSRFYSLSFKYIEAPAPFSWIWKAKIAKKLKIFVWLVFRDRINSRNLLRRKNFSIGGNYSCVLCSLELEELTYHLIFQCSFAERCWDLLNIHWDHNLGFFDTFQKAKSEWQLGYFMETFAIEAWKIWKIRNNKIFRGGLLLFLLGRSILPLS
jgi:hypothetical protein